ncbi:MAG: translation initiation factor IF-3 [Clostridia bacterium]|nr:translation initiation factor IF-3 [Clostridia bacterium]
MNEKSQIRVIGPEGEQMGIMTVGSALESAYDKDLDLVLISPASNPPVCRILDYGKFRFDREKRKKEAKKNQTKVDVKEVQLSCHIDTNDFNTKANNAKRFLQSGNKVKVLVIFKGRQMAHQEVGRQLLERFREYVAEVGSVDKAPMMEGRSMTMIISPVKQTAVKPAQPKPEQKTEQE